MRSRGQLRKSSQTGRRTIAAPPLLANATGNGVQTVFPVSSVPFAIYINGVYQNQNTYSFANGNVTFTQAPPLTSTIEFVF
jgi:hypothetical protein